MTHGNTVAQGYGQRGNERADQRGVAVACCQIRLAVWRAGDERGRRFGGRRRRRHSGPQRDGDCRCPVAGRRRPPPVRRAAVLVQPPPPRRRAHRNRGLTPGQRYPPEHRRLRRKLTPVVARGTTPCWRCGVVIGGNERWDLGHSDFGGRIMGPEHVRCNRRAAAEKRRMIYGTPPAFAQHRRRTAAPRPRALAFFD